MVVEDRDDPRVRPVCAGLSAQELEQLFYPVSASGKLKVRTAAWPDPDVHESSRRLCGHCPVLAACMLEALRTDVCGFRGGLSPDERIVLAGARDRSASGKGLSFTPRQVLARLKTSGFDMDQVRFAFEEWQRERADGERALWVELPDAEVLERRGAAALASRATGGRRGQKAGTPAAA